MFTYFSVFISSSLSLFLSFLEHNDIRDNELFNAMEDGGTLVTVSKLPKSVLERRLRQHVEGGLGHNLAGGVLFFWTNELQTPPSRPSTLHP